jgi:hypothetical protein
MAHLAGAVRFVARIAVRVGNDMDAQYEYREDQRYSQQPQKGSRAH